MLIPDIDKIQEPMFETHESGVNMTYEWRVKQLKNLLRLVKEGRQAIIEAVKADLGRHSGETIVAEVKTVENEVKFILKNLKKWMQPKAVASSALMIPSFSYVHRKPLAEPGVLIIAPFNYPFYLSLKPLIGALAGGNPAVIKPSELTIASGDAMAKLVKQYFEPGAVQVVLGDVPVTTALLEKSWGKVMFTGSPRVGKIIGSACAKTLTPVILELGGKCPIIVDENVRSSNLRNVADRIIFAKTFNAGQTCVSPDTLFVHESHAKELCAHLVDAVEAQFGMNPKEGELGRIINVGAAKRLQQMIVDAENSNATIIYGGSAQSDPDTKYICPTFILNPPSDAKVMKEEIFGPLLPIVTFSSRSDGIQKIKSIGSHPLQFTVFTSQEKVFEEYTTKCRPAAALRNDCLVHLSNHNLPFGGLGGSGIGHYFGEKSFEAFTHPFPVSYRPLGKLWDLGNLRCHPFLDWKVPFIESYVMVLPDIPVLHTKKLLLLTATAAATTGAFHAMPETAVETRSFVANVLRCIAAHIHPKK